MLSNQNQFISLADISSIFNEGGNVIDVAELLYERIEKYIGEEEIKPIRNSLDKGWDDPHGMFENDSQGIL